MFLDNILPSYLAILGSPKCFLKRLQYPELVSFGLLANLSAMRDRNVITDIDSIWDIGANQGQFAFMANTVWPTLPIYSFEPDPDSFEKLSANFKKFNILGKPYLSALSDKTEVKKLMRYGANVNNSFLVRNEENVSTVDVACTTLDLMGNSMPNMRTAYLKLDVQGFELTVLAGAQEFLKKCKYVQVEVSFSPAYAGGATSYEVMSAMNSCDFECIEILDLLRNKTSANEIIEADLLFRRNSGRSS